MERVRFFNAVEALPSLRDLGITEDEGVCELIDNSFDANCKDVRIHLEKKNDGNFRITVTDDGDGIPTIYSDFQGIPYVLAVGGRVPKEKKRIGRFGWGLSATATCLTTRTSVYSKNQDDVSWRKGVYDIQQLSDTDDCTMDNEVPEDPPWLDLPQTGTIVVLEDIDRCRYSRLGDLKNNLVKNLGRVYRKMLGAGKSIVVSWEDSEGRIKTKSIEVSDPLHLMPNSREVVGTKCTAEELGVCTIVMQGESLPEIFNPKTNSHATVTIRMVRLPITQIRRNLGLRAYFIGGHEDTKIMNKWNINPDYSGFSIIRNGREIDSNQTLRVFRRREGSTTAGFRGEISFDGLEDIDALFGVQVNKSRYSLDRALQDMIYSKCRPTFDQYLKDHEKDVASAKARAKKLENEPPISEGIASMAASLLPQRNISEEERERGKLETQKKVETLLTEARITGDRNILEAQEKLNEAKSKGDEREIEEANMDLEFATENKQQMEQNVKDRFAFESPCRKQLGIIGTGEIFDVEHHGDEAWITINPETPFFKRVYERATQNPEQESLLDLLIFSMAWAEHISADNPEKKRFWMDARRDVSVIAYKFCELMPEGA